MQFFKSMDTSFAYQVFGDDEHKDDACDNKPVVLWAHGWGQDHTAFSNIISPLERIAKHISLDFPGFGQSPAPSETWGTQDYADAIASWMRDQNMPPVLWVGHSFGCRVGLQMATRHPDLIRGLCLIAGAGLKRKRPLHKKIYFYCRIKLFKLLKRFLPNGLLKDKIITAFGSSDYRNAGTMRHIFVRVVNEDLTEEAQNVTCPTILIYGSHDTETPPEFGTRFSQLIKGSKLHLLEGQDHYSVLQGGRHPVIKIINDFIGTLCTKN